MASGNGAWSPTTGGGNRGRLEWQIDQSPAKVSAGTASVSLRLRVWYRSRYSISDSSNSYTISGSWSGSGSRSISHGGSGGRTLLFDGTITVSTSYAGTVSRSFSASFSGINATPNIPSVSGSHTVGRRPVNAPNPPTGVSFTRQSDTQHKISWTRNATTARPYSKQRVQRQQVQSNGEWPSTWATVGPVSGTATSWTDTGTRPNGAYRWRVVADNATNTPGISSPTGAARTTPDSPVIVGATRSGAGIRVAYRHRAPYLTASVDVQGRGDGGSWQTLVTGFGQNAFGANQVWEHSDPDPSKVWEYRVRARAENPTLLSGWSSVSNTVQLLAAPNAPTRSGPSGTLDRDGSIRFEWLHNPVDSSDQSAYELRYRLNGGAWVTLSGTTAETRTLAALGVSGTVEWQVRTKGAHVDWSPWSAVGSFTLAATPTVAINSPVGGTLTQSRVTLVLGYSQDEGSPQSRVQAELVQGGRVIETLSWAKGDTGAFRTNLDNNSTYTVRVRVQAANGLWSEWDEVTFTTDFPTPLPRVIEAEWDRDTGAVTVSSWADGVEGLFEWTGTPHDSTSEWWEYDHLVATNLEHDPTGVTGDGWGGASYHEPAYDAVFVPGGFGVDPFGVAPFGTPS